MKRPEVLHPGSVEVVGGQVWFTKNQGSVKQLEGPHVHLNVKGDTADIRRTKWSFWTSQFVKGFRAML